MLLGARAGMNASYSSKKDSSATKDSKYSVEYTMDVAVHAGQDSMPAGMAKVLEMLNNSISRGISHRFPGGSACHPGRWKREADDLLQEQGRPV